ncbi:Ribose import ATP-binding protein RbsA [subsurface metagenome]
MINDEVILEIKNITKKFPGVVALDNVSFDLKRGEVHTLVGENGAGKSTLVHIIAGVYEKDMGQIFIKGKELKSINPITAEKLGITMIHQTPKLIPSLSIGENIFMGRLPKTKFKTIDWNKIFLRAREGIQTLDLQVSPMTKIKQISSGQKAMVAIIKAFSRKPVILILDEPTAFLTENETKKLFNLVLKLKKQGVSFIYISHNLEEVFEISDKITVLRNGKKIATVHPKEIDRTALIKMMIGREIEQQFERKLFPKGKEIFRVENLSVDERIRNISFNLRRGEILGLAGLVGAGRTEIANAIFGLTPKKKGKIFVEGKEVNINSPRMAIKNSIGFLTEERDKGLIMGISVRENIVLTIIPKLTYGGIVKRKKEINIVSEFITKLRIVTPTIEQKLKFLSGGNQQKVMLAKWIASNAKIMIFDEPTNGVDVGARREIYELMNQLTKRGVAIILISSDLDEVMGMSDRILVMRSGSIVAEFERGEITKKDILEVAFH